MPSKENSSSNFWNESANHMQFITDEHPHALITYIYVLIVPKNEKACQRLAL